jgi:hypothetical protein
MLLFASRVAHSYTYAISFLFRERLFAVRSIWIEDQEHNSNNHRMQPQTKLEYG